MQAFKSQNDFDADRDEKLLRSVSPFKADFTYIYSKCSAGKLYAGLLNLKPSCDDCGFGFSVSDQDDSLQDFVVLISGVLTAVLVVIIEAVLSPHPWFYAILWTLFIAGMGLFVLRIFKITLIAHQFYHDVDEGNLDNYIKQKKNDVIG